MRALCPSTALQVMDDNRMLTLASNERIPLTASMRLLLEINHMNHCSPATVSRGGVIFVNADDIGWKLAVESWVERLEGADYRPLLSMLFRWRRGCMIRVLQLPAVTWPPARIDQRPLHVNAATPALLSRPARAAASTWTPRWSTAAATSRRWCRCLPSTRSRRCAR